VAARAGKAGKEEKKISLHRKRCAEGESPKKNRDRPKKTVHQGKRVKTEITREHALGINGQYRGGNGTTLCGTVSGNQQNVIRDIRGHFHQGGNKGELVVRKWVRQWEKKKGHWGVFKSSRN